MSAESGISTFRNNSDSHWSRFDPHELASPYGWQVNPRRVWAWYEARRGQVLAAQPNAGHIAIAQLAETLERRTGSSVQVDVITQNVDNLHERAGTTSVIHLHGSLFAPRCADCHQPGHFASDMPDLNATEVTPPRCSHCGGHIRPGVVWFDEDLPQTEFRRAIELLALCDVMLVVGTSGVVYPAAELPIRAHRLGKFVAEINPESSGISGYAQEHWRTSAATGLPLLLQLLRTA